MQRQKGREGIRVRLIPPSPNRSTGQDAAAVIKNELQQLLPGIKIFLDVRTLGAPARERRRYVRSYTPSPQVDDLDDIGALEEYIGRSQMILFFLSKGYFRSKAILPPRTPL